MTRIESSLRTRRGRRDRRPGSSGSHRAGSLPAGDGGSSLSTGGRSTAAARWAAPATSCPATSSRWPARCAEARALAGLRRRWGAVGQVVGRARVLALDRRLRPQLHRVRSIGRPALGDLAGLSDADLGRLVGRDRPAAWPPTVCSTCMPTPRPSTARAATPRSWTVGCRCGGRRRRGAGDASRRCCGRSPAASCSRVIAASTLAAPWPASSSGSPRRRRADRRPPRWPARHDGDRIAAVRTTNRRLRGPDVVLAAGRGRASSLACSASACRCSPAGAEPHRRPAGVGPRRADAARRGPRRRRTDGPRTAPQRLVPAQQLRHACDPRPDRSARGDRPESVRSTTAAGAAAVGRAAPVTPDGVPIIGRRRGGTTDDRRWSRDHRSDARPRYRTNRGPACLANARHRYRTVLAEEVRMTQPLELPAGTLTITVVDSHTGGEPTRVSSMVPPLQGATLAAPRRPGDHPPPSGDRSRRRAVWQRADGRRPAHPSRRRSVRGRRDLLRPVTGVRDSGHGMIGLVETLRSLGRIGPGEHLLETPAGVVPVSASRPAPQW